MENVYKTFFKHYSKNVYLETFRKPKIGFTSVLNMFCKRLDHLKTFLMFTGKFKEEQKKHNLLLELS